MKKMLINLENPNGILVDETAEELAQRETDDAITQSEQTAEERISQKENLKSSAKTKLVAGEPLTEEEADTIVL